MPVPVQAPDWVPVLVQALTRRLMLGLVWLRCGRRRRRNRLAAGSSIALPLMMMAATFTHRLAQNLAYSFITTRVPGVGAYRCP